MLSVHTSRMLRATSRPSLRIVASQVQRLANPELSLRPPHCSYSSAAPSARLNVPIDYATTPLLAHTARAALSNPELPPSITRGGGSSGSGSSGSGGAGLTKRMNLYQAINDAMSTALAEDESVLLFGEDVAFGGVFRCSMNLKDTYGGERVFNTPLSEQGLMGFAIGLAAEGMRPIAEIQFADYVYPAFDQLVNEAARFRYRDGTNKRHVGGLTARMPCGAVGHGAMYHSQSPEALFTHIPGLRVVMPRSPIQAKGLLLAAIRCNDPVVFMEPKVLYRAAVEQVPVDPYELPLSKAEVLKPGADVTIVSYGQPLYLCMNAIRHAEQDLKGTGKNGHFSVELIDLRTIYPWDKETVLRSVRKTGRCIVVHESMVNQGVGAEVAATIQEDADTFVRLEAPVKRVAGWSTHMPLAFEKFVLPDVATMPSDTEIISAFVADAPPGELSNVVADIESLTGKPIGLDEAFAKYNEEQFTTVQLPGGSAKEIAIVSEWSRLGDGRYYDPSSATSFAYDHKTQKASAAQSYAVEGELVQSILKALGIYAKDHYERPAYGVYPLDGERVGVLIVSNKYSPQNFWNGRWRSRYIYDPASGAIEGAIRVDVHYYEDGNVRLLTDKPQTATASGANGVAVVREIAALEKAYQEELNKKFLALSEGAFKGLRRQLPVTRQKIEWEKVASYRLGQDIGGGGRK